MKRESPSGVVMSRRSFVSLTAATLAGAALLRGGTSIARAADAAAATDDGFGGLLMGLQSYTLRDRTFAKMLEAMHDDLKLHRVELYGAHLSDTAPPPKLRDAKEKLKAADVTAISYGVVGFSKDAEKNRKVFEFAKTMGMTNISCDPDPDAFDSLDKLTEEYGITVGIHDHGPGHRWGKIDTIEKAIKDHSKRIGLTNDTGHFIRAGEDPIRACEVFKDRLPALHLKDFKKKGNGWEDVPAGDGSLDVDGLVKWLITNNYKGTIFIEYEGGEPVPNVLKSLDRVRAAVKKAKA